MGEARQEPEETLASASATSLRKRWPSCSVEQADIKRSAFELPQTPSVEAAKWSPLLLSYHEILERYQGNEYIVYGYRPVTDAATRCFAQLVLHAQRDSQYLLTSGTCCMLICLWSISLSVFPNAVTQCDHTRSSRLRLLPFYSSGLPADVFNLSHSDEPFRLSIPAMAVIWLCGHCCFDIGRFCVRDLPDLLLWTNLAEAILDNGERFPAFLVSENGWWTCQISALCTITALILVSSKVSGFARSLL